MVYWIPMRTKQKAQINSNIIGMVLLSISAIVIAPPVYAENVLEELSASVVAGMTPDSPLYIFDTLIERLVLMATPDTDEKVRLLSAYAEEKLAETVHTAETDSAAADAATRRYETYMKQAVELATTVENTDEQQQLIQSVGMESYKHLDAYIQLAASGAVAESAYIDRALQTLGEQETQLITSMADEESRKKAIQQLQQTVEKHSDKIPPEVQEKISSMYSSILNDIKEYLRAQIDKQVDAMVDSAKDALIQEIEEFEL